MAHPNFVEKTFVGGSKNVKFVNAFSFESFQLNGILFALPTTGTSDADHK